jgi:hypothetical protein
LAVGTGSRLPKATAKRHGLQAVTTVKITE